MQRLLNCFGGPRQCYVCKRRLIRFTKHRRGSRSIPQFQKKLSLIGSDVDNFGCVFCDSHDRERHLFMYFDRLGLWDNIQGGGVLHFAPEKNLSARISSCQPHTHVLADASPSDARIERIDATAIPFPDNSFDVVIANHVLEHIPDYRKALSEFFRVLKPGGIAILQTPYSKLLEENFEDRGIASDAMRLFFHGQEDHVRTFGLRRLLLSFEEAGFTLALVRHADVFDKNVFYRYGVNPEEDLLRIIKPLSNPSVT